MFNGRKGHNELIKFVRLLKNEGIIVNMRFAAEEYNGGIEKLQAFSEELGVAKQIEFVGFLGRKNLDGFLNDADLYMMPTKAEGLTCISMPVSGNPELLPEHYLVEYDNVHLLAERIRELVTDKAKYEKASSDNYDNNLKYESSLLPNRRDVFYKELKNKI